MLVKLGCVTGCPGWGAWLSSMMFVITVDSICLYRNPTVCLNTGATSLPKHSSVSICVAAERKIEAQLRHRFMIMQGINTRFTVGFLNIT